MIDITGVGGYFGVVKDGFFEEVTFEPWYLETELEAAMERCGEGGEYQGANKFFRLQTWMTLSYFRSMKGSEGGWKVSKGGGGGKM